MFQKAMTTVAKKKKRGKDDKGRIKENMKRERERLHLECKKIMITF